MLELGRWVRIGHDFCSELLVICLSASIQMQLCSRGVCYLAVAKTLLFSPSPLQSSCISFSYWKETVSILLSPDQTSPCAIVSYIDKTYMDIDRDFTEE